MLVHKLEDKNDEPREQATTDSPEMACCGLWRSTFEGPVDTTQAVFREPSHPVISEGHRGLQEGWTQ